ncbi:immunity 53 family protein [Paenibacillus sp. BSR1-1]|uniref:immunity 53 family protein n=1 Tax=Paenibacillus sp. BSR1-1 TaxID=3020845 RepID=UPI0025AF1A1E|nr:immunity 53 family protein [Paenibacillus sp. BSR1-1]MDN3015877.1 immunity 53 family protein [Paenibacillus sp. BSR1-1]
MQKWYLQQCDGDWEHQFGISVQNLDNPGWMLTIDLEGTNLEDKHMDKIEIIRNEQDWLDCWIEFDKYKYKFHGAGGPNNLEEILTIFKNWAEL